MKIFFEQIKQEGNLVKTSFSFDVDDISFFIKSFDGKLYPIKKGYVLDGDLELVISDVCDRCLKKFDESFLEHITVELVREDTVNLSSEEELDEDDLGFYHIKEDHVDIHEILFQESILLRPMKRLCVDECKGICPKCGRNLNEEKCECNAEVDERWKALTKLLQNNK
ncbi:MAG: DUF177 domain-containing protein [Calditerrivibrio sp.]|nr:DUF177 domain-containing protein [Calditerrivibrio sp.]